MPFQTLTFDPIWATCPLRSNVTFDPIWATCPLRSRRCREFFCAIARFHVRGFFPRVDSSASVCSRFLPGHDVMCLSLAIGIGIAIAIVTNFPHQTTNSNSNTQNRQPDQIPIRFPHSPTSPRNPSHAVHKIPILRRGARRARWSPMSRRQPHFIKACRLRIAFDIVSL